MKSVYVYSCLLILLASTCQKLNESLSLPDSVTFPDPVNSACLVSRPVVHKAQRLKGRIVYRQDVDMYAISYYVPGTIDSQWTGLACNLPDAYKVAGREVIFSGEFKDAGGT